jgi:hypothetical protein
VNTEHYERLIRWYPQEWRDRYGGEMTALLEDSYATASDVPARARLGLVRRGLAERARTAGLIGSALEPTQELRAGAVLVLCGWPLFLVAGAVFGKFADNWWIGTPAVDRLPASASFNAVAVLGVLGCTVVGLAALLALPSFVRLVRAGRWSTVRRPVWRAGLASVLAALLLGGGLAWAHHLGPHDRNGGLAVYGAAFIVIGLAAFVAILSATAAAVAVARRIDLPQRVLRGLGVMALVLSVVMTLLFAGFVTWWATQATYAPTVLLNGIGNGVPFTSGTVPPTLAAAGLLMVLGLALAVAGTVRIARGLRPHRPAT